VLGRRIGFGKIPMPPHSMVLSVIGAALLWVGWFGFNGGSAVASNGLASSAFCTTTSRLLRLPWDGRWRNGW